MRYRDTSLDQYKSVLCLEMCDRPKMVKKTDISCVSAFAVDPKMLPEYRLLSLKGEAGASSSLDKNHHPKNAFHGMAPWVSGRNEPFPHIVWFQFPEKKVLAKIGFLTRADDHYFEEAVVKFQIIG